MASTRPRNGRPYRRARAQVLAASDICWLCGQPGADTVDHVVPISLGGDSDDPTGMRPAHRSCNSRRGNGLARNSGRTSRQWLTNESSTIRGR